jgi:N-sulfoglucosamine sulfohydrolase
MKRPNVLLVTFHDLGRFLGCYGVGTVQTPNIDSLAEDGIRFSRAFCVAPQCSPSRATLFTGRYPHSNGVMGLTHANFAWDLNPDERHVGGLLQGQGYRTGLVGIHHESRYAPAEEVAGRLGMDRVRLGGRAEKVTDNALALLEEFSDGERPFYLQVGFTEPHRLAAKTRDEPGYMGFVGDYIEPDVSRGVTVPRYLRDTPGAREEVAELQGAVRHVDQAVGRLLAGLDALGLRDETLVILTTDHGIALPRAKCSLYDPGLEVALVFRYPGRGWDGGRVTDAQVSNVDILPTLLELLELPAGEPLQGRSFLSLLDGARHEPRREIFAELTYHDYYDPQRCIRTDRHKLIVHFSASPSFMDPSQSWRPRSTTVTPADPARAYHPLVELYDLEEDPGETTNLAGLPQHAALRNELLARLHDWLDRTGDPILRGAVTSPLHLRALAALRGETERITLMGASNPETD